MTYSEIKPISQTDGKHVKKSPVSNKQQRMNKQFKRIMMFLAGAAVIGFFLGCIVASAVTAHINGYKALSDVGGVTRQRAKTPHTQYMGRMMTGVLPVKFPWTGHLGTWTSNRWTVRWTMTFRNLHITCVKGTTLTSPWSWH